MNGEPRDIPGLFRIRLPLPFGELGVNAYLIANGKDSAIIDTGPWHEDSYDRLGSAIRGRGLGVEDVKTVIVTHYHADHCGAASQMKKHGARIVMARPEASWIEDYFSRPEDDAARAAFWGHHEVPDGFAGKVAKVFSLFRGYCPMFTPDAVVGDGEVVHAGGVSFRGLVTPGHTPGHLCLLHEESRTLFSGDHLVQGVAPQVSLRGSMMDRDPLGAYFQSLEQTGRMDIGWVLPGHGDGFASVRECLAGIRGTYASYLGSIQASLGDRPRTAFAVARKVFPDAGRPFARWMSLGRVVSCLLHLKAQGLAEEIVLPGGFRVYRKGSA